MLEVNEIWIESNGDWHCFSDIIFASTGKQMEFEMQPSVMCKIKNLINSPNFYLGLKKHSDRADVYKCSIIDGNKIKIFPHLSLNKKENKEMFDSKFCFNLMLESYPI